MISTFVYGTPHGFNLYEGVGEWNDYFMSFYISTRKGRRLMVNRRNDGLTIYSFLCYEIMERQGRPNAFFGCSVVVDNNMYTPDLKVLFEFFDYLFDLLIERGKLFYINEGNILQYKVDKFSGAASEVDWLKSNLPNIFTRASSIQISTYDNSFSRQNSGKVIGCNIDTPPSKVLDYLRKFHWVAISPYFTKERDIEELNLYDINDKYNRYTQQLLHIAVNPSSDYLTQLESINSDCKETIQSLKRYNNSSLDDGAARILRDIIDKYCILNETVLNLIDKINSTTGKGETNDHSPTPDTTNDSYKECTKCGRNLPKDHFSGISPNICKDCLDDAKYKTCTKCGKKKPVAEFNKHQGICDACLLSRNSNKEFHIKPIIYVICILTVLLVLIIALLKSYDKQPSESSSPQISTLGLNEDNDFQISKYRDLISLGKYSEAFDYLENFGKKDQYISELKDSFNVAFAKILDTSEKSSITDNSYKFITSNINLFNKLGLDSTVFYKIANNYVRLLEILKQNPISTKVREEAYVLLSTIPYEQLTAEIRTQVDNKRINESNNSDRGDSTATKKNTKTIVKIVNTNKAGKELSNESIEISGNSVTKTYEKGTYVEVFTMQPEMVKLISTGCSATPLASRTGFKVEIGDKPIEFQIDKNFKLILTKRKPGKV